MWDIVIDHGFLLTMEGPGTGFVNDGAVAIQGNAIRFVGPSGDLTSRTSTHRYIDARGCVVMPGLIDAHIHTGLCILRGVSQDIDNWMQRGIWPFSRVLTGQDRVKGSLVNIIEGVLAGTTTFCDYDDNMVEIVKNHVMVGTRARVANLINELSQDMSGVKLLDLYPFDPAVGQRKLAEAIRLLEEWNERENCRITCLIGAHAPDMMSKELLLECMSLAEKYNTLVHMHVAQGDREINQMMKRYGKRTIEFLDDLGYLGRRLIAVHLTEATADEARLVASRGASMVLCSGSIGIVDGIVPPAGEFLDVSDKVGLGSDQAPGNNCNNMFNEMKFTAILNKCKYRDPKRFPAWEVLRMATIDGARAIGMDHQIGSLKPGKKADLIIVDLNSPALCPVYTQPVRNIVPNLVYSANGSQAKTVIIDGRVIVEEGKVLTVDAQTLRDAQDAARYVGERVGELSDEFPLVKQTKQGYL